MRSYCLGVVAVATVFLGAACPAARAQVPDREELRQTLKQLWQSLDTFQFTAVECALDANGKLNRKNKKAMYNIAHGSGGRLSFQMSSPYIERAKTSPDMFKWHTLDGRSSYKLSLIDKDPLRVDAIYVRNQSSIGDVYEGVMNLPLWLIMPGGKPLYLYLDADAVLSESVENGQRLITLTTKHKGSGLRCDLDPAHDWLPVKVELEGIERFETNRFKRWDGRWFPAEGISKNLFDGDTNGFYMESVSINQPIDPIVFRPLPGPAGSIVVDEVAGTSKIEGGEEARNKLMQEELAKAPPPTGPPVVASRDPGEFPWWLVTLGFSLCLVGVGIVMVRRR